MPLGASAETDEAASEREAAVERPTEEAAWEVNSALVNEAFETWVADPALVDRTERHMLPSAVRSSNAFAPPASSSSGTLNALQLLPSSDAALFFGEDLRVYSLGVQPLVGDSRLCKHGTVQVVLDPPPYSVGVAATAPSIALVEEPQGPTRRTFVVCYGDGTLHVVREHVGGAEWTAVTLGAAWPMGLKSLRVLAAGTTAAATAGRRIVTVVLCGMDDATERGAVLLAALDVETHSGAMTATVTSAHRVLPERDCEPPELVQPYAEASVNAVSFLLIMRTREAHDACVTGGVKRQRQQQQTEDEEDEELPAEATLEAVRARVCGGDAAAVRRTQLTDDSVLAMGASWQPRAALARTVAVTVAVPHGVHVCLAECRTACVAEREALTVVHARTAAALAHVVKGKPRRRFVLLDANARACVVVERDRYALIYEVPPPPLYDFASHCVVDLAGEAGESLADSATLGSVLMTVRPRLGIADDVGVCSGEGKETPEERGASQCWLWTLHRRRARAVRLRDYDPGSTQHLRVDEADKLRGFHWGLDD